ncbi:MAG: signal transduction histidine kinase [Rhodospirillales bacterium]|nr:signal transduction histidine kinase [Rhodospirillales bacterium]
MSRVPAETQDREALLQATLDAVDIGVWNLDHRTGAFEGSPIHDRILGCESRPPGWTTNDFLKHVLAEDRQRVQTALDLAAPSQGDFVLECRILRLDGTMRWIEMRGRTERDAHGRPARTMGVLFDITARKDQQAELHANEERFRVLTEKIGDVVWVSDPSIPSVLYVSPGYANLWGRPKEELEQRFESWIDNIHPDDRSRVRRAFAENIDDGTYDEMYRVVRPDGSERWVRDRGWPIGDGARVVGIATDITALKRSEEAQLLLVAELSHRVKNALATVISIAQQTRLESRDAEEFGRIFEQRIRALAHVHGLLAETQWHGASLTGMVAEQLEPYQGDRSARVAISGPDLLLRPKTALLLGMILHELATNAAKHGALSTTDGSVDVSWAVLFESGMRRLILDWTESGGPQVTPPTRRGFGRTLVERGLGYELGGTARLGFEPTGLRARLEIPLPISD